MANVLSLKDRKILNRNYWLRLIVTFSFVMTAAITIGLVSLVPAYFSANTQLTEITLNNELQDKAREADKSDATIQTAKLANLQIEELIKTDNLSATNAIEFIMRDWDTHSNDIIISGFSYSLIEENKKSVPQIRISGEARSRTALNEFVKTLKADPVFSEVSFPVSDLAGGGRMEYSLVVHFKQ